MQIAKVLTLSQEMDDVGHKEQGVTSGPWAPLSILLAELIQKFESASFNLFYGRRGDHSPTGDHHTYPFQSTSHHWLIRRSQKYLYVLSPMPTLVGEWTKLRVISCLTKCLLAGSYSTMQQQDIVMNTMGDRELVSSAGHSRCLLQRTTGGGR